jgi:hypothetical protein
LHEDFGRVNDEDSALLVAASAVRTPEDLMALVERAAIRLAAWGHTNGSAKFVVDHETRHEAQFPPVKRVANSGAAGSIASHLCDRLLGDGYAVPGLDNFVICRPRWRFRNPYLAELPGSG